MLQVSVPETKCGIVTHNVCQDVSSNECRTVPKQVNNNSQVTLQQLLSSGVPACEQGCGEDRV